MTQAAQETLKRLRALGSRVGEAGAPMLAGLDETAAARKALAIAAEAGLLGWCVPAAWGGADSEGLCAKGEVSVRALCALRASLAYHDGMLDVMAVMQGLGSYALARAGSDELRAEWLPLVASGERIAAFALTEAEAGSDLGGVTTRAERHGARWRLSGAKTFISNCGIADVYSLLARTGGEPGDGGKGSLTMFLVPGDAAGLRTQRFEVTSPHPIGDLHLDGVEVSDAQRLGAVGAGLEVALGVLGRFRTSVAAAANGFARRALDESCKHLGARRQFGRPLASFQGLRFDLAEMDMRLRAAELLVDEAAAAVDGGERATAEVARAKLYATENASWLCDRALQHHGGLGVKRGSMVERLWRDVRALRIYEGSSEVQKLILARSLLEGGRLAMAEFTRHIFICVNDRPADDERGCCKARGADQVAEAFKRKLYERGLKRIVRPNRSMCLDQCAQGVTLVVYPEGVWYGHVAESDVDEIIEQHIIGGRPVQRLVLSPEQLTGRTPPPGMIQG